MQTNSGNQTDRKTDPVGWAREETVRFSKQKARRYGSWTMANLVAFALLLKGMPGHSLWPILGPLLGITLVCLTAITGFYLIAILGEWVDVRKSR
jgi:hypothetical protein